MDFPIFSHRNSGFSLLNNHRNSGFSHIFPLNIVDPVRKLWVTTRHWDGSPWDRGGGSAEQPAAADLCGCAATGASGIQGSWMLQVGILAYIYIYTLYIIIYIYILCIWLYVYSIHIIYILYMIYQYIYSISNSILSIVRWDYRLTTRSAIGGPVWLIVSPDSTMMPLVGWPVAPYCRYIYLSIMIYSYVLTSIHLL